jgi:hypothetical protein
VVMFSSLCFFTLQSYPLRRKNHSSRYPLYHRIKILTLNSYPKNNSRTSLLESTTEADHCPDFLVTSQINQRPSLSNTCLLSPSFSPSAAHIKILQHSVLPMCFPALASPFLIAFSPLPKFRCELRVGGLSVAAGGVSVDARKVGCDM